MYDVLLISPHSTHLLQEVFERRQLGWEHIQPWGQVQGALSEQVM
jgi:hypothetical protein